METFTIPEAAAALGKSLPNFRRWLTKELIPAPFLIDSGRSYQVYCTEELEAFARVLVEHERNFTYLCEDHTMTITQLFQVAHGIRDTLFGRGNGRMA